MLISKKSKQVIEIVGKPADNWIGDTHYLVDSRNELAKKIRENAPYFDFELDENGELIDITPTERPPEPETTLSEIVTSKIERLDMACKQTIYNGMDIQLSTGETQHFTLDEQDQLNLSGIGLKLLMGATEIAWHEDDKSKACQFYSATDAMTIISSLTVFKEYHITYFRDLRIYVNSLTDIETVNAIDYGFILPEEAKSDVLKSYEEQLGLTS